MKALKEAREGGMRTWMLRSELHHQQRALVNIKDFEAAEPHPQLRTAGSINSHNLHKPVWPHHQYFGSVYDAVNASVLQAFVSFLGPL